MITLSVQARLSTQFNIPVVLKYTARLAYSGWHGFRNIGTYMFKIHIDDFARIVSHNSTLFCC